MEISLTELIFKLLERVALLEKEMKELKGENEKQKHQIKKLKDTANSYNLYIHSLYGNGEQRS